MINFMHKQEHITYITEFGVAIKSPQLPLWILKRPIDYNNTEHNIQIFFSGFLEKHPEPLIGLVADEKTALICAKFYNKPFSKREIVAYYLEENIKGKIVNSHIRPPTQTQDIKLVQKWIYEFYIETLNVTPPSFSVEGLSKALKKEKQEEKQEKKQKEKQKPKNLPNTQIYLLKNETETVAMGMLSDVVDNICRINLIYTPPHLRGRGYGKQIVHGLVSIVQNNGHIPMLYTTLENIFANKLYQSLGFVKAGQLTEILFDAVSSL